jgi:hypothetical protein
MSRWREERTRRSRTPARRGKSVGNAQPVANARHAHRHGTEGAASAFREVAAGF